MKIQNKAREQASRQSKLTSMSSILVIDIDDKLGNDIKSSPRFHNIKTVTPVKQKCRNTQFNFSNWISIKLDHIECTATTSNLKLGLLILDLLHLMKLLLIRNSITFNWNKDSTKWICSIKWSSKQLKEHF